MSEPPINRPPDLSKAQVVKRERFPDDEESWDLKRGGHRFACLSRAGYRLAVFDTREDIDREEQVVLMISTTGGRTPKYSVLRSYWLNGERVGYERFQQDSLLGALRHLRERFARALSEFTLEEI